MMWRVFAWGLEELQELFGNLKCARDVFEARKKVSERDGYDAIKVETYGGQFANNVPTDLKNIGKIWRGGVKIWSKWQGQFPILFSVAQKEITSMDMPIYCTGILSQILLYGDSVRLGIVVPPTDVEMAKLILK